MMEGVNAENKQVLLLDINEVNKRIKEALYSINAGCPETVLYELSQASYHGIFMQHISKAVWPCLKSRVSRWQRIQKALSLLTYLALNGSDTCLHDILTNLDAITALQNLRFPSNQRDIGYLIGEKSRNLVNLVCDRQELKARRKEAADLRSRIVSVSSTNGQVETQVIHKPIYAIDRKSTFGKSALIGTNPKPRFITKLMGETVIHRKLADIFNSVRKDRKPKNNTASPFPVQSMMEYWPKETYRHKPEMLSNPKLAQKRRSHESSDSYTTDNSAYSTSSSDDEVSASDSDYSRHHHRGGTRSIENRRNFVESVSNSSSSSVSDDTTPAARTDRHKELYTENATGHHVGYHDRELNRTDLSESYHRIDSKPYDREPPTRYTEYPKLDMRGDYKVRSGRPVETHLRYDVVYPMYQMTMRNMNPDKRVDPRVKPGYATENHHDLRYNVHTAEKGANPFARDSRY